MVCLNRSLASLAAVLVAVAASVLPASWAEDPSPYQRLLTGDDAKKAAELDAAGKAAAVADRYQEAVELAEAELQLRRRIQGDDHWQTLDVGRKLQVVRKMAGLPADARKELASVVAMDSELPRLFKENRYEDALAVTRKAVAIRRRHLGDEDIGVLSGLGWEAFLLKTLGRYNDAEPIYRGALAGFRKVLGEEHPSTATSYNNLASNLLSQGRHLEAEPLFRQTLAIRLRVLGEKHPLVAQGLNNLADVVNRSGRYAEAEPLFRRSLDLRLELFGADHVETAVGYHNLGCSLLDQGQHAEAEIHCRRALEIRRKHLPKDHPQIAIAAGTLGLSLQSLRRFSEAEELFREGLAIQRKVYGPEHPAVVLALSHLAYLDHGRGKYVEAELLFRECVELQGKLLGENHPERAQACHNLATCLFRQGRYPEAEDSYRQSLAIYLRAWGSEHPETISTYTYLGNSLAAQGRSAEAVKAWTDAARHFETARLRVAGTGLRRAIFTAEVTPWPMLAAELARQRKPVDAWNAAEHYLARGLLEDAVLGRIRQLSHNDQGTLATLRQRLASQDLRVSASLSKREPAPTETAEFNRLLQDRDGTLADLNRFDADRRQQEVKELTAVQSQLTAGQALLLWIDVIGEPRAKNPGGEHWACVLKKSGPPIWVQLPGTGADGAWTQEDDDLPKLARAALAKPASPATGDLARRLARQRLAPVESHLGDVQLLIVCPAGRMAGLPIEALTDQYTIAYAPSATMLTKLQEQGRNRPQTGDRKLLALGDPTFKTSIPPKTGDPLALARSKLYTPLPGTRHEIEAIRRLFPDGDFLLGSDASEQKLAAMAQQGELKRYRILHLATHGDVDASRAENCALILAQDYSPDSVKQSLAATHRLDGRVDVGEVLSEWELDADLVVLSACETGLGREAGGEGLMGFSQAFLSKGARSLIVSQWQVSDTATSLLMVRFYENWLGSRSGKPLSKAEALKEAKLWLRNLTRAEAEKRIANLPEAARGLKLEGASATPQAASDRPFAHPYYWSAFILIGDPA